MSAATRIIETKRLKEAAESIADEIISLLNTGDYWDAWMKCGNLEEATKALKTFDEEEDEDGE